MVNIQLRPVLFNVALARQSTVGALAIVAFSDSLFLLFTPSWPVSQRDVVRPVRLVTGVFLGR